MLATMRYYVDNNVDGFSSDSRKYLEVSGLIAAQGKKSQELIEGLDAMVIEAREEALYANLLIGKGRPNAS